MFLNVLLCLNKYERTVISMNFFLQADSIETSANVNTKQNDSDAIAGSIGLPSFTADLSSGFDDEYVIGGHDGSGSSNGTTYKLVANGRTCSIEEIDSVKAV